MNRSRTTRSMQAQARQIIEITVASLALAGTVGVVNVAQAQTTPTAKPADATAQAAFKRADVDADNKLSPAEAAKLPAIAQRFKTLDTDKDGFLSAEEFMASAKAEQ
ncbi:EF-hand domain-containing protein [Methylibium sp.]|uniref:EF-hand domain-containing protein n=1 Tax=Methylibium sp. TaxID=2067992 RepID=UPI003D0A0E99